MGITNLLEKKFIKVPLQSKTKIDVIEELLDVLKKDNLSLDFDKIFTQFLEREKQLSTGLEKGIALPHVKTNLVKNIILIVGISPDGVDFDSQDKQLSHIFFMVLAPADQPSQHIEVLSEIAKTLNSDTFIKMLKKAKSADEDLRIIED